MESHLSYTQAQWDLVLACFVMAAFALLGCFIYLLATKSDVSPRYRPSGVAGAVVAIIAFSAYLPLILSWITGFDYNAVTQMFTPSGSTLQFSNSYRYVDWVITVPILVIEMAIISTMVGKRARGMRALWVILAIIMVVTGFLGADTFDSTSGRLFWGIIFTIAFIPLYILVLKVGFQSAKACGASGVYLRNAAWVLMLTWGVYPLAYCVPFLFEDSSDWAVARQVAFTIADITAKVGYGLLIHYTAKARTAIDVAAGDVAMGEGIYMDGEKVASAQPVKQSERVTQGSGSRTGAEPDTGTGNGGPPSRR